MDNILDVPISAVMTTDVITINIEAPFSQVEKLMRTHHIRHLPVVNNNGVLYGIISQNDLYRTASPFKDEEGDAFYDPVNLDSYILKHIMTKDVRTLAPQQKLIAALDIMVNGKIGCIPIVDSSLRVIGIITPADILKVIAKIRQIPSSTSDEQKAKLSSDDLIILIQRKAFELWDKRGRIPGNDLDIWLEAEAIVKKKLGLR